MQIDMRNISFLREHWPTQLEDNDSRSSEPVAAYGLANDRRMVGPGTAILMIIWRPAPIGGTAGMSASFSRGGGATGGCLRDGRVDWPRSRCLRSCLTMW